MEPETANFISEMEEFSKFLPEKRKAIENVRNVYSQFLSNGEIEKCSKMKCLIHAFHYFPDMDKIDFLNVFYKIFKDYLE